MTEKTFELTEEGKKDLEIELLKLKEVDRPANIESLKEARAQGDLSENADYDAARDEQSRIESRILELETILKNHIIIKKNNSSKVSTGKSVTLTYLKENGASVKDKVRTFLIVGTIEANPLENKLSCESPLGKAILNKKENDLITFNNDNGDEFEIKINAIK
ncbi:MAG: transcription elongation factor GreA [Anaeroplasmataceae bacterium]